MKVFGHENCPPELDNIVKHISEECEGLPLAIVVIDGVPSKLELKQDSWEKIARNVSEAVNSSSDALSVSDMHLPPHLRHCFLYISCFPEDYEINVRTLIRFWLAEVFLISDESKDMEELGYEYLEDLDRRSLVLIEKKIYDGKIKTVKIHDFVRDLCIRKIRDENFFCIINEFQFQLVCSIYSELIPLRYLCFACKPDERTLRLVSEGLYQLQNLQTLIAKIDRPLARQSVANQDLYQWCMKFEKWRMPELRHLYKTGWSEYSLKNLVHLYKLEKPSIYADPYPNMNESLSNNISFPLSLKKLNLSGSLPNLQVWETNEGEFCQLKVLVIDSTNLHEWIADASSFASLERLPLYECRSLIGDIPTLELIEVDIRDSSVVAYAKCIEEGQQSLGNDEMQVRLLKSCSRKIFK